MGIKDDYNAIANILLNDLGNNHSFICQRISPTCTARSATAAAFYSTPIAKFICKANHIQRNMAAD